MIRNTIVYVSVATLMSVMLGHIYYLWLSENTYAAIPWGYEYIGSIAIVTVAAMALGGMLSVIGGTWYAIRQRARWHAVMANAAISTVLYAIILATVVFRVIPLNMWDRRWPAFIALSAAAASVAHCAGYVVSAMLVRRPLR